MKKLLPLFITLLLGAYSFNIKGQDFHLSQYDAAPIFLNPALAGKFDGLYRIHGHYRTQWNAIATKPFQTALLSFDLPVNKIGLGAQVINKRAGAGNYNVFNFSLSANYTFKIGTSHFISPGIQAGLFQKSLDFNKLYFENQYTPVNGGTFDQSLPTGENVGSNSILLPDFTVGLLYFYGKEESRVNPFIGYTLFHLIQPTETFLSEDNSLPMRHLIHAGIKVNITDRIQFLPKVMNMYQLNNKELAISGMIHYYLKDAGAYIIAGPTFRSKDAAIIEAGVKIGKYTARISYDINTSSLNTYTDGRGGFEISLTYTPRKIKPNPIKNCPRI
ncbi:MAG: hypothetical protein Kow0079_00380 [Vicingaceae bacterium]